MIILSLSKSCSISASSSISGLKDGGVIIRDERASTPHGEETLDSIKKLDNFLNKWFPKKGFTGFINIEKADKIWRTAQKG